MTTTVGLSITGAVRGGDCGVVVSIGHQQEPSSECADSDAPENDFRKQENWTRATFGPVLPIPPARVPTSFLPNFDRKQWKKNDLHHLTRNSERK